MTLGIRKLTVVLAVAVVFLIGNLWLLVDWLQEHGVIDWARYVRSEFLTGTAIAVILVLLVLLAHPGGSHRSVFRRCSVCDHILVGHGPYCSACGSKAG